MPPNQPDRETVPIPQFAIEWGISRTLAYELARLDRLPVPVIRLGRRMVLSRRALDQVLADATARPADERRSDRG